MTAPEIGKIADSATEGLKDDKELRLDVRQELVSHIEDAVSANRAAGMGDEQSVSEGLKAFGPVTDIAAELVAANRSRMRFRQLARIAARALIVPAALMVAFWVNIDSFTTARFLRTMTAGFEGDVGPLEDHMSLMSRRGISEEAAFLCFGDTSLESDIDRQRGIWESDPTNRVFYGNYITMLAVKHPLNNTDDLRFLEQEIRRGEELDPDNARYNYLLAGLMTELASEIKIVPSEDGDDEMLLDVIDRDLLDKGMAELLKAGSKPFMDTYCTEMLALRMSVLPEVESLSEVIARISMAAGIYLPDVSKHRNLARTSLKYAELLVAEGRKAEALPYLEAWYPLCKKGFAQDGTLIEALVSFAIAGLGGESAAVLEQIGETERAEEMRRLSGAVTAVYDGHKARLKSDNNDMGKTIRMHGSILAGMLIPAIGSDGVTKEDLAPGREIEHTWVEKGWLSGFISCLFLIMLGLLAIALYMRFVRGGESAPLLLLPDPRQTVKVLLFSVVVPLAVFFIYTRHTDLSGRDLSLLMWPRFVLELHLLTAIMLSVAAYQMQKLVDARCRYLALGTPRARKWWVIFLLSIVPVGLVVWLATGRRNTAMFRGTVARSLIPILGLIIVLVGGVVHPHLVSREARLVKKDSILSVPEEGGFTKLENEVTRRLNREALAAMESVLGD